MDFLQAEQLRLEQLIPLIRELLDSGKKVRFYPRGTSMLPMLRQEMDSVVLAPVPSALKKYDLPLYLRDNGQFVIHRVIGVGDTYTCMGDNQFVQEPGLRQDQMIALVTAFYRGDRRYEVTEPGYRCYCHFWYHTRHIRCFWRRVIGWIRRHLR